jgi:hypothetical protein
VNPTTDRARDFKLVEIGFSYWATTLNRVAAHLALGRIKQALAIVEAALQREREEAAQRLREYWETHAHVYRNIEDACAAILSLGPDPQSPAPMGREARKC